MDINIAMMYIASGILLGAIGQGARAIAGIKKAHEASGKKWEDWMKDGFDSKQLVLSLFIGGIAGGLASIALLGKEINKEFFIGLAVAGYAGTDFIQGFIETKVPKMGKSE